MEFFTQIKSPRDTYKGPNHETADAGFATYVSGPKYACNEFEVGSFFRPEKQLVIVTIKSDKVKTSSCGETGWDVSFEGYEPASELFRQQCLTLRGPGSQVSTKSDVLDGNNVWWSKEFVEFVIPVPFGETIGSLQIKNLNKYFKFSTDAAAEASGNFAA